MSPKGGLITLVRLKNYTDYLDQPLELVKEGNSQINLKFTTKDGRRLNTKDFYFTPQLSSKNGKQTLSLKQPLHLTSIWNLFYAIDAERFLVDFTIQSSRISVLLDSSEPAILSWETNAYRNSKVLTMKDATLNSHTDMIGIK